MSWMRRTGRKEPVYGEQGLRLLNLSRAQGLLYRFWRFDAFTNIGNSEISEFVATASGVTVSSGTWTASGDRLSNFNAAAMKDGALGTRAVILSSVGSAAALQYDHGSPVQCDGFRYAIWSGADTQFLTGLRVSGSNDGTNYVIVRTFSGMGARANSTLSPIFSWA
jgi:hypothetical protein